jgi:hypothetical protein
MGHPQFDTQDDVGLGDGIPCIPEWQLDPTALNDLSGFNNIDVDFDVWNVFIRLRSVLERSQRMPFSPTQLHDLTCFVIHRLLSTPNTESSQPSPVTQSLRYAIIIYMLIIQGPTYYSHAVIMNTMVTRFVECFKQIESTPRVYDSLDVWFISIGLLTSTGTTNYEWFVEKAQIVSEALQLHDFDDTLVQIKSVLWLETPQSDENFRSHWDKIFHVGYTPESLQSMQLTFSVSPSSNIAGIL